MVFDVKEAKRCPLIADTFLFYVLNKLFVKLGCRWRCQRSKKRLNAFICVLDPIILDLVSASKDSFRHLSHNFNNSSSQ